jgi:hypothetical protein
MLHNQIAVHAVELLVSASIISVEDLSLGQPWLKGVLPYKSPSPLPGGPLASSSPRSTLDPSENDNLSRYPVYSPSLSRLSVSGLMKQHFQPQITGQ